MTDNFEFKEVYGLEDLLNIMALLRGEGGCPWDAQQTHESIRKNFIEETYEVIEAIDNRDAELLKEELGDVLLQVVFHSQMEKEAGRFDFNDVCDGICKKLVERHPHVFGDVVAKTSEAVLQNWDEIKKRKKGQKNQTEIMLTIPRQLPALMRASKVQQKAAKAGFDFSEAGEAMDKLAEEVREVQQAVRTGEQAAVADEMGDVLFSAVNIARLLDVDGEEALTAATDKFISRYEIVERLAAERGIDMHTAGLEKLDTLWDEAKQLLQSIETHAFRGYII